MKRVKEEGRRKIERKDARWEAKEETKIGRKEKVGVDGEREGKEGGDDKAEGEMLMGN